MQAWRKRSLFISEIGIARTEGQTIFFPYGRHWHYSHWHIEIRDHALDYDQLLVVFLTKISPVRLNESKQFHDDCRNTFKMPRPKFSAQTVYERVRRHYARSLIDPAGIELGRRRVKNHMRPGLTAALDIRFKRPRILVEILIGTELQRIDKNGDDYPGAFRGSHADQTEMTLMQGTHGRDKAQYCFAPGFFGNPLAGAPESQIFNCLQHPGFHRSLHRVAPPGNEKASLVDYPDNAEHLQLLAPNMNQKFGIMPQDALPRIRLMQEKRFHPATSPVQASSVAPWLLVALLVFAAPSPALSVGDKPAPVAAAASRDKSAAEIASAVANAYGGINKIKETRERATRSHGTVAVTSGISGASNSFECDILERDNKMRMEMTVLGQPMVMGFDGNKSWTQFGDWICASTDTASQRISEEIKHGLTQLTDIADPKSKLEPLPKQLIQGKQCDGFKLTSPDGKATSFFADPVTHLVLRSEYMGVDHELGLPAVQAAEYQDYRPIAGSMCPFKCVQFSGAKKSSETLLKTVDPDVVIEDKSFQMPPETEIARLKEGPVTIPFEFVGNEILIKVRINNGAEAKFIVDTGASQSVLDKTAASAIGPYPLSTFSITAGSKAVPLSYTKLSSLSIADLVINDVPALVTDLSSFTAAIGERPAGLIGANILRRFLVTIDYDEKKLVLSDPRNVTVPAGAAIVPTAPVFGATALLVKGQLEDKVKMNFLVDTGAAFNNLPLSLARPLFSGNLLPVGQIYGLDGQKIDIGSIKLKSLKLGQLTISNPVFAMAPDTTSTATTPSSGLFTAGAMGILGNPTWSQYKMTIDYRNERLILESPGDRDKFSQFLSQLEQVDRQYLGSKDPDQSIKLYERLLVSSQVERHKASEALAVARIAGCYADKFSTAKEGRWLDIAAREYERANKLAVESRNKTAEGQILAQWALLYFNAPRSQNDLMLAQELLKRALMKAPMEPSIYAALGNTMMKVGKAPLAEKLLDQAIMLDPANWQALWAKYKLCQSQGNKKSQDLVLLQLQRYYPNLPDVLNVNAKPSPAAMDGSDQKKPAAKTLTPHTPGKPVAGKKSHHH